MALSTQEADDNTDYVLEAKLDNAKSMTTMLKAIHFKDVNNFCIRSYIIAQMISRHKFFQITGMC